MGNNYYRNLTDKILVIDKSREVQQSVRQVLKGKYEVLLANSCDEAFVYLQNYTISVVLMDIPRYTGHIYEYIKLIRSNYADVQICLFTAHADIKLIQNAIRLGAYDCLFKPFDVKTLADAMETGVGKSNTIRSLKEEIEDLKDVHFACRVTMEETKNSALTDITNMLTAVVKNVHLYDNYTWNHSVRVENLVSGASPKAGLCAPEIVDIRNAALLHDIGKTEVKRNILKKGKFGELDHKRMRVHPVAGAQVIREIPLLHGILEPVLYHHERYDGNGYPYGIHGSDIPLHARLLSVADAIDSMKYCQYKENLDDKTVAEELDRQKGKQFDPEAVEIFQELILSP